MKKEGISVVFISHKLDEMMDITDRITILNNGKKVATVQTSDINEELLAEMVVGKTIKNKYPKVRYEKGETLLRFEHITLKNHLNDISFELKRGEVLGIVGLLGAGKTEIAKALFGVYGKGNDKLTGNIWFSFIGLKKIAGVPFCVLLMICLYIVAYIVLKYTGYGRKVYATGSNRKSAWLSGINVRLIEFSVYVIQGVMSALVGVVLTSKLLTCTSTIGNGMEVNAIAAVVIGGASMSGGEGSVVGTIVGALILTIISNAMNLMSVNAYLQQVVMGLIIIMAILFDMVRKGYIFRKPDEE